MDYQLLPVGAIWQDGIFCVPKKLASEGLKFASELQIKVLLLLLAENGKIDIEAIARTLGTDLTSVTECLDYWVGEGVLAHGGETVAPAPAQPAQEEPKKQLEHLPMPSLSPKDIVTLCNEQPALAEMLRGAQEILGASLSSAMQGNLVNMVTYYGLPVPVVLTLLQYYKTERDRGRNITTRHLQNMAREWADEEIFTLAAATDKLQEIQNIETLWSDVLALCRFDYRKPTSAQRRMLKRWSDDFSFDMISFACNTMKKYTEEDAQSLKAVDNILKEWKRKGFGTPADVKAQKSADAKQKKNGKLKSTPSFDIEEIAKTTLLNDDFDI